MDSGHARFGELSLPPCDALALARFIVFLIRAGMRTRHAGLIEFLARMDIDVHDVHAPVSALPIELLGTRDRIDLFARAMSILDRGAADFRREAQQLSLTVGCFRLATHHPPACFDSIVGTLPDARPHVRVRSGQRTQRRRGRGSVETMCARLQRRSKL
ncbi:hypothetical protein [Pandoraea captiosa]|nr:hypothetical protein [Pandoraea captiosa]